MASGFKCQFCNIVLPTAQGLKSHKTRLHRNEDRNASQTFVKTTVSDTQDTQDTQDSVLSDIQDGTSQCAPTSTNIALDILLANLRRNVKVIHRIPKSARIVVADALSQTIDKCVQENSADAWERLLLFAAGCFQIPLNQNNRRVSLATLLKRNVSEYLQGRAVNCQGSGVEKRSQSDDYQMARCVEAKVAEGDVTGAVRILSSEETLAPFNEATKLALLKLHPGPESSNINLPETDIGGAYLQVTEREVRHAILSFSPGSAGGLDLLRPQHLKDLIGPSAGNSGLRLLLSLTKLCNVMLAGDVPLSICPVLYGASICALLKKNGGIRPIAIGNTLRRLVAKIGCNHIRAQLCEKLCPVQLGFGIRGGAEAASHSARRFLSYQHTEAKVFLKIDFRNAFNVVNRDIMLRTASEQMPQLYPFLHQCYSRPSHLAFGEDVFPSQRGIQQGDPLGPALFSMVIHPVSASLSSEMNIWYLDDSALGGHPDVVLKDFKIVSEKALELGLEVNLSKCELFILKASVDEQRNIARTFQEVAPDIRMPEARDCTLLGAPLVIEAIEQCLDVKCQALKRTSTRLVNVKAQVAYFILKHSQAIPKLSHVLRCAPTWKCEEGLKAFDDILRITLERISNTRLEEDAWEQSSLPIAKGGLGIRHACTLAIPAFVASVHSVIHLTGAILPSYITEEGDSMCAEGTSVWSRRFGSNVPDEDKKIFQKEWKGPGVKLLQEKIYRNAVTTKEKARLLGVTSKEAGAFLNALPSAPLGTLLNDDTFRISVALRLGSQICQPHTCICGATVDVSGVHGLSCLKSAGRRSRHTAVNDIIRRGLASADIPATLEPSHLALENNSRPDGITQIPWENGKSLVWDFTCTNGMAPSYVTEASIEPLYAATVAETNKNRKYEHLRPAYKFMPIAVECLGSFGRDSLKLLQSIGRRITEKTGEKMATQYFLQRISVAIQRGNAACVLGTIPSSSTLEEFFNFL